MKRLVLYAEGAGELSGSITRLPATGTPLPEQALGSAHILLRRAVAIAWQLQESEIVFAVPKLTRARHARGSDLLDRTRLRELVTWPKPEQVPDLVIVLVDSDGDRQRRTRLREWISDKSPHVVAMAIEEFESWLVADADCVRNVLGRATALAAAVPEPEKLARTAAKRLLGTWLSNSGVDQKLMRRQIALLCELSVLQTRCPSFAEAVSDLKAIAAAAG